MNTTTQAKHQHSWFYWVVFLLIFKLFGLIVFAHYWMYKLDMADLYSK